MLYIDGFLLIHRFGWIIKLFFFDCQIRRSAIMRMNYEIRNPYTSSKKAPCHEKTTPGQHTRVLTMPEITQLATSSSKFLIRNPYLTPKNVTHPRPSPSVSYLSGGAMAVSTGNSFYRICVNIDTFVANIHSLDVEHKMTSTSDCKCNSDIEVSFLG